MENLEKLLGDLHYAVAEDLLSRVKSGEATSQDIGNCLKMLKDNNITVDPSNKEDTQELNNILNMLPVRDETIVDRSEFIN